MYLFCPPLLHSLLLEFSPEQIHLECFALKLINDASDFSQQKRPGVDEVDPIHHYCNDAVPALKATSQAVFDEERVAEHKAMLFIAKEDGTFTSWADLEGRDWFKHII